MAMKIQDVVFWVLTQCSDVIVYQHFGGPCYLHLPASIYAHLLAPLHPKDGDSIKVICSLCIPQ